MCSITITTEPQTKEVPELPTCHFCKEQATIRTADGGMEIDLCGIDNHPEYAGVPVIQLVLTTAE